VIVPGSVNRLNPSCKRVIHLQVLTTGSSRLRKYWSDLKVKLQKEGSQLSEEIGQLKMCSPDGKFRETDAADVRAHAGNR